VARFVQASTWGWLSPPDLQDAYQEALEALWPRLRRPGAPLALFKAIARFKVIDALRRRQRRPAATNAAAALERIDAAQGDAPLGRGRREP
jgi:DNA-directed RNA polymerase specialized sigma24 family protein